jgi:glucokinase
MPSLAIGIDLGCTHIKGVLLDDQGTVLHRQRVDTNEQDDQQWKNEVVQMVRQLESVAGSPVAHYGLCAPGLANAANTCIAFMPGRLPGLENFNWSDFTGKKMNVLNDAHAALMAEAAYGAAKGLMNAFMLTLGTGVGGGILINGRLYQGASQMAGHLGHITVNADDALHDVTNIPGSIEDAIGNLTIEQRSKGKYKTTSDLVEAYNRGDIFATWLWLSSIRKLSVSIASLVNVLAPEAVIIGGGISLAGDHLLKPLRDFLNEYEWQPGGKRTPVMLAHFSDLAGAIGAASFAKSNSKK